MSEFNYDMKKAKILEKLYLKGPKQLTSDFEKALLIGIKDVLEYGTTYFKLDADFNFEHIPFNQYMEIKNVKITGDNIKFSVGENK